jgi:hypothetical protein
MSLKRKCISGSYQNKLLFKSLLGIVSSRQPMKEKYPIRPTEEGNNLPDITGNLREVGSIQSDTTEPPFKNGEKRVESADQTHTELSLDDISQEDLGPGTATL